MMKYLYIFWQLTWGFFQSFLGLICLVKYGRGKEHFWFHGAYVTRWDKGGGISLGMFIFIGDKLAEAGEPNAFLTHEYGHSIQSLILGPLYLPVVGIPSSRWAGKYSREMLLDGISYFSVFPEKEANTLGTMVTGIRVPDHIPISLLDD